VPVFVGRCRCRLPAKRQSNRRKQKAHGAERGRDCDRCVAAALGTPSNFTSRSPHFWTIGQRPRHSAKNSLLRVRSLKVKISEVGYLFPKLGPDKTPVPKVKLCHEGGGHLLRRWVLQVALFQNQREHPPSRRSSRRSPRPTKGSEAAAKPKSAHKSPRIAMHLRPEGQPAGTGDFLEVRQSSCRKGARNSVTDHGSADRFGTVFGCQPWPPGSLPFTVSGNRFSTPCCSRIASRSISGPSWLAMVHDCAGRDSRAHTSTQPWRRRRCRRSQLGPNGPMVERSSQFLWTRQLHPAVFSVRHIPAAFSIDAKGPTMAR
jgi:hypothetical protein